MPKAFTDEVVDRMAQIYHIVESHGCVTTTAVMAELGLSHSKTYYALSLLKSYGRVEEVVLGNVSLWCRDKETAKRTVDELVSHVRRLLCNNGTRYATPTRVANLIVSDKQAFKAFARYVQFDMTKRQAYRPNTLSLIKALLQMAFGNPVRSGGKVIYYVTC
jgi:hypothetical protein